MTCSVRLVERCCEEVAQSVREVFVESIGEAVRAGGFAGGEVERHAPDLVSRHRLSAAGRRWGEDLPSALKCRARFRLCRRFGCFSAKKGFIILTQRACNFSCDSHRGVLVAREPLWVGGVGPVRLSDRVDPLVGGARGDSAIHGGGPRVVFRPPLPCLLFHCVSQGALGGGERGELGAQVVQLCVGLGGSGPAADAVAADRYLLFNEFSALCVPLLHTLCRFEGIRNDLRFERLQRGEGGWEVVQGSWRDVPAYDVCYGPVCLGVFENSFVNIFDILTFFVGWGPEMQLQGDVVEHAVYFRHEVVAKFVGPFKRVDAWGVHLVNARVRDAVGGVVVGGVDPFGAELFSGNVNEPFGDD